MVTITTPVTTVKPISEKGDQIGIEWRGHGYSIEKFKAHNVTITVLEMLKYIYHLQTRTSSPEFN